MRTAEWHMDVEFQEDDSNTEAAVMLTLPDGTELRTSGRARRNPADPKLPQIGEEIAAARALLDLVHDLLDKASREIETATHKPAHLKA